MAQEHVIEARGLRKSYGSTVAVDGLDLEMSRGEVLSLLGPNGAGKTTTVEIFEGYRRRDAGEARVLGEDPQRAGAAWRAWRGIVLQESDDVADLTVSECVRHFSRFYPAPARPDDVIEQVGLTAKRASRIRAFRVANGAVSTLRSGSSAVRNSYSSTNPPPALTPKHDGSSGLS